MERTNATIKVDVQKLQLLTDRICQTIDALNQMRQSTVGHQQSYYPMSPAYMGGYQHQPVWGNQSFMPYPTANWPAYGGGFNNYTQPLSPVGHPIGHNGGFGYNGYSHGPEAIDRNRFAQGFSAFQGSPVTSW